MDTLALQLQEAGIVSVISTEDAANLASSH
jgi:hypothetical protein